MDVINTTSKIEEKLVYTATQRNMPLGGSFELLPLCNMNCKMCFLRLSPSEMNSQGHLRTVEEWISLASQAKDAGLLFLLLTGGEIFLYPDFDRLYLELYKMGFFITLNSNGSLVTEELAEMLGSHLPRRINITLYGASDETYKKLCGNPNGFTQTMSGIKLLLQHNVPVKLNGSITAYNMDEIELLQCIAHDLGLPIEIDSYMFPSSRKGVCNFDHTSRLTPAEAAEAYFRITKDELSEDVYKSQIEQMALCYENTRPSSFDPSISEHLGEPLPCRGGRSSFWINWKGNMTPCVFMEEQGIPVFETGFAAAWEGIKKCRQNLFLPASCTQCERRAFCTVCGACALTETGNLLKRPEYMCDLTNEKLRLASKLMSTSE